MPAFDYSLVADIYDAYVRTEEDVPFFQEECARTTGRVLELMCGTGRLSLRLLEAGASLTCVDSSAPMLSMLQKKLDLCGLTASIFEQDVTRLSIPGSYSLALIPFNSFAEITEDADQSAALTAIRQSLEDHSRLIVTLHNPAVRLQQVDGILHTIGRFPLDERGSTISLSACEQYCAASGLITGHQILEGIESSGRSLWKRRTNIRFRLVTRERFHDLVMNTGFTVEGLFGNYDRSLFDEAASPYMIWSLRR